MVPEPGRSLGIAFQSFNVNVYSIWLVDLQNQLPNSVILDGFDISVFQFPPKEWLPANVRLDQLDVLGEIPQNLRGKYDIVNIRYFACVVKENNVDLVIRNALDMLSMYVILSTVTTSDLCL